MSDKIGRSGLNEIAVTPAIYICLKHALDTGASTSFNQKQLDTAFQSWLLHEKDNRTFADGFATKTLSRIATNLVLRDAKKAAPIAKKKTILSNDERDALKIMGVAAPKPLPKAKAEEEDENPADDGVDLEEKLFAFAEKSEPGLAVAAVLIAQKCSDKDGLGTRSCALLLDKYGTRATNEVEKHLLLDGINVAASARERDHFHAQFGALAAAESDPKLAVKLRAMCEEPDHDLKNLFAQNTELTVIGLGQAAMPTLHDANPKPFVPVTPRKPGPFDLPNIPKFS